MYSQTRKAIEKYKFNGVQSGYSRNSSGEKFQGPCQQYLAQQAKIKAGNDKNISRQRVR